MSDNAMISNISSIFGNGDAADRLIANDFDIGVLRPWLGRDGRSYVTRTINGRPKILVSNAPATLTKDAWILFDTAVVRAVYARLRAFADIRAAGNTFNLPNGMAHTVLQWQTVGDITPATISMDPARRSEGDQPSMDIGNLPLPIIHKDFDFSARQIAVSRSGIVPMPLDTTTAELAGRKVAEAVEQLTVGATTFSFGGSSIYGFTNFPNRALKTDMPVPDGTNGTAVINAILALRQLLINNKHYGPYMFYTNDQWSQVLDNDFKANTDSTLRQRILSIEGIQDVRTSGLPAQHLLELPAGGDAAYQRPGSGRHGGPDGSVGVSRRDGETLQGDVHADPTVEGGYLGEQRRGARFNSDTLIV
jgi:hypothetical protein